WNRQHIVDKCEKQILADLAHGGAAETNRSRNAVKAPTDQHNVAGFLSDVRPGADRDAQICLRERRRVVDAVADHRNGSPALLKTLNHLCLAVRFDVRSDVINADLCSNRTSRGFVVAAEQQRLELHSVQFENRSLRVWFDLIGNVDCPGDSRRDRNEYPCARVWHGLETRATRCCEFAASHPYLAALNLSKHAGAGFVAEAFQIRQSDTPRLGMRDDRLGQRMLAELFGGCGESQQLVG